MLNSTLEHACTSVESDGRSRNVKSVWVKEQHVRCADGTITEYQVNMMVTFVLDD
jgi:flavin-binding protein dodecin